MYLGVFYYFKGTQDCLLCATGRVATGAVRERVPLSSRRFSFILSLHVVSINIFIDGPKRSVLVYVHTLPHQPVEENPEHFAAELDILKLETTIR
jgi:hypothetical protein